MVNSTAGLREPILLVALQAKSVKSDVRNKVEGKLKNKENQNNKTTITTSKQQRTLE